MLTPCNAASPTCKPPSSFYETRLFPDREYTFKHALTHDVTYGGLLAERRQLLHANIVQAIERLHADRLTEHVDRLAYHATRGALWEKAHTFGVQAGRRAAAQSANRAVLEAFQGALTALEYLPETPRTIAENIDLRFELRDAHFVLSEMAPILPHLEKAQALAERIGDRERMALAALYKSGFHWVQGEHHLAVETSLRGLAAAEELDSWELHWRTTKSARRCCFWAITSPRPITCAKVLQRSTTKQDGRFGASEG